MAQEGLFEIGLKLFVRRGGDLLVLRAANTGLGDFPGGRIGVQDSLFDLEASIRRELLEELGADVKMKVARDPLFTFPYTSKEHTQEVLGMAYAADYLGGTIRLSAEHTELMWLPPQQALEHFDGHFRQGLISYLDFSFDGAVTDGFYV